MYTLSASNAAGLSALLQVNSDLDKYNTMATTGKKVNSAADNPLAYMLSQTFDNRTARIGSINDNLSLSSTSVNAASASLTQIRKTLTDTLSALQAASQTAEAKAATAAVQLSDTDAGATNFNFTLDARTVGDLNASTGLPTFAGAAITSDTYLSQGSDATGKAIKQVKGDSQVFIGGQAMRAGMEIKVTTNAGNWTIKVGAGPAQPAAGTVPGPVTSAVTDSVNHTTTVYTVGQLMSELTNRGNLSLTPTPAGGTWNVAALYTGPSFAKDGNGNPDITKPLGISFDVDYAESIYKGDDNKAAFGKNVTIDRNGNTGFFNLASMFTPKNPHNKTASATYTEDQATSGYYDPTSNVLTAITTLDQTVNGGFVYDKSVATLSKYGNTQNLDLAGVVHNFQAGTPEQKADATRAAAVTTYNNAAQNITSYVMSSVTTGVNLLLGSALNVILSEDGQNQTYQLTLAGTRNPFNGTAQGLSLLNASGTSDDTKAAFARNYDNGATGAGLMGAIAKIQTAIQNVDAAAAQLANINSTLSNRQSFNKSMIQLLTQATSNLTAADMTQVSAVTASLQVQQQFAQSIMVASKQSQQALLQFLR